MKRSDLPQLAVDFSRLGGLLLHECQCETRTHRWRYDVCTYSVVDEDDSRVTYSCTNGYIAQGDMTSMCPQCWVSCSNGRYLASEGDTDYRPCPLCKPHTLGEHISRAANDMGPGPRAANTDPDSRGWRYEEIIHMDGTSELLPVALDATGEAAITPNDVPPSVEWDRILETGRLFARQALDFVATHRPDRHAPTNDPSTDNEYCRHHLTTLGSCEPRYRGDLCRTCYDFELAHRFSHGPGLLPTRRLLEIKEAGRRWTQTDVAEALKELKPRNSKKNRRKAS